MKKSQFNKILLSECAHCTIPFAEGDSKWTKLNFTFINRNNEDFMQIHNVSNLEALSIIYGLSCTKLTFNLQSYLKDLLIEQNEYDSSSSMERPKSLADINSKHEDSQCVNFVLCASCAQYFSDFYQSHKKFHMRSGENSLLSKAINGYKHNALVQANETTIGNQNATTEKNTDLNIINPKVENVLFDDIAELEDNNDYFTFSVGQSLMSNPLPTEQQYLIHDFLKEKRVPIPTINVSTSNPFEYNGRKSSAPQTSHSRNAAANQDIQGTSTDNQQGKGKLYRRKYMSTAGARRKNRTCMECNMYFGSDYQFQLHKLSHEKSSLANLECKISGPPYYCPYCEKFYSRKDTLRVHCIGEHKVKLTILETTNFVNCNKSPIAHLESSSSTFAELQLSKIRKENSEKIVYEKQTGFKDNLLITKNKNPTEEKNILSSKNSSSFENNSVWIQKQRNCDTEDGNSNYSQIDMNKEDIDPLFIPQILGDTNEASGGLQLPKTTEVHPFHFTTVLPFKSQSSVFGLSEDHNNPGTVGKNPLNTGKNASWEKPNKAGPLRYKLLNRIKRMVSNKRKHSDCEISSQSVSDKEKGADTDSKQITEKDSCLALTLKSTILPKMVLKSHEPPDDFHCHLCEFQSHSLIGLQYHCLDIHPPILKISRLKYTYRYRHSIS